ncbi:MAG: hypothetical protein H7235_10515, partial [Bdellovibrionaceae bacterium]|nr:hypothetical protein [Pseudobdellovibrionaceae bacterium]
MFNFQGKLDISKSWMNRALIIQSFDPEAIFIEGSSSSQDVLLLRQALKDLADSKKEFYAGLGGTTFRFLALRVSRHVGEFFIHAEPTLLARPQNELLNIFQQLGIQAQFEAQGLRIKSQGWKEPKGILKVCTNESSQFLSAVLLNSVNLSFDLHIRIEDEVISADYFKYTLQLLKQCGIKAIEFEDSIFIAKSQKLTHMALLGEVDMSSAFSLVVAAVFGGSIKIENWSSETLQPDIQFLKFFQRMGIQFEVQGHHFKISQQHQYKNLSANLNSCPDLFPVLAVLCAFSKGESHLYGATHLKFKESDRILKTTELLKKCGFDVQELEDGMRIKGQP